MRGDTEAVTPTTHKTIQLSDQPINGQFVQNGNAQDQKNLLADLIQALFSNSNNELPEADTTKIREFKKDRDPDNSKSMYNVLRDNIVGIQVDQGGIKVTVTEEFAALFNNLSAEVQGQFKDLIRNQFGSLEQQNRQIVSKAAERVASIAEGGLRDWNTEHGGIISSSAIKQEIRSLDSIDKDTNKSISTIDKQIKAVEDAQQKFQEEYDKKFDSKAEKTQKGLRLEHGGKAYEESNAIYEEELQRLRDKKELVEQHSTAAKRPVIDLANAKKELADREQDTKGYEQDIKDERKSMGQDLKDLKKFGAGKLTDESINFKSLGKELDEFSKIYEQGKRPDIGDPKFANIKKVMDQAVLYENIPSYGKHTPELASAYKSFGNHIVEMDKKFQTEEHNQAKQQELKTNMPEKEKLVATAMQDFQHNHKEDQKNISNSDKKLQGALKNPKSVIAEKATATDVKEAYNSVKQELEASKSAAHSDPSTHKGKIAEVMQKIDVGALKGATHDKKTTTTEDVSAQSTPDASSRGTGGVGI